MGNRIALRIGRLPALRGWMGLLAGWAVIAGPALPAHAAADPVRLLVFTKTSAYRHSSVEEGVAAVDSVSADRRIRLEATEDADRFRPTSLDSFDVVMFLNTSGDVLNEAQQMALRKFVIQGGGFVGVHGATDTEYDWPWYGTLVGAWFDKHPKVQDARLTVVDTSHASTRHLPRVWERRDEWYTFRAWPRDVRVLVAVDEGSYSGGTMGPGHPMSWCREIGRGRSWVTAMGHTDSAYREPLFLNHLTGGILWAAGRDVH